MGEFWIINIKLNPDDSPRVRIKEIRLYLESVYRDL